MDAIRVLVIGGGSAAFAASRTAASLGAHVTMVNAGLPIGGCCVNVGCVPSKTLLRAGGTLSSANETPMKYDGAIRASASVRDFGRVIGKTQELVASLRESKYQNVASITPNLTVIHGLAKFVRPNVVCVNGENITADKVIIATGSTTKLPDIRGLQRIRYFTNESIFKLKKCPTSLVIIGGGYIALECAQLMSRLGSKVTILQRSERLIRTQEADVSTEIRKALILEGIEIHTGVSVAAVRKEQNDIILEATLNSKEVVFKTSTILLATGRVGNTSELELNDLEVDANGFIVVDDTLQTSVPEVFAAGDVIGDPMFVYTAAYEGDLAARNALSQDSCCLKKRDYIPLPWVIFTEPQVCGVGLDEKAAAEAGIEFDVSVCAMDKVPRAITAFETELGFIKLLRGKEDHRILGARIVCREGSELLMQIALAMKFGMTSEDLQVMLFPYLTLSEGVKLACLGFDTDLATLSCCST